MNLGVDLSVGFVIFATDQKHLEGVFISNNLNYNLFCPVNVQFFFFFISMTISRMCLHIKQSFNLALECLF